MNMNTITKVFAIASAALCMASCEKFLDRPTEDSYNQDNFYKNDTQCEQGVNYLYNSPWYDFQRGFIKIGEVMSGNMYWGSSPYLDFTTNGTDVDLVNMSYSLWAVNGHANNVIANLVKAQGPSEATRRKCIGEALTWKAMAYFFMVRTFGAVPIIHDNAELLASGEYNNVEKVEKADVFEYIIYTLETAMEMLPKATAFGKTRRIDYYAAEALLAKVYLTRAGLSGSLDNGDLAKAAQYAKDVIDNSGRTLTPVYSDVFRLSPDVYNATGESLIAWQWTVDDQQWTRQNTLQSDLAMVGFDENGDCWGGWGGPSVDLADAFGVSVLDDPGLRVNKDDRRQATMMMPGDVYSYFWTDHEGGFDFLRFIYDTEYGAGGPGGQMQCPTGTNNVKHLFGNNADHVAGVGVPAQRMANQLPTHLIRLSDVYLIYAEAECLLGNRDEALIYVNKVRARAHAEELEEVTFEDIWKERRLELAGEGDRWYDFVRRSYYDMAGCIAELKAQRRSSYYGLDGLYKGYYETGVWSKKGQLKDVGYDDKSYDNPNVTASSFTLPFPTEDVVFNKKMASDATPIHVDVRETYPYNF